MEDSSYNVYHVVIKDKRFDEEDTTPLLLGLNKLRDSAFCAIYAYVMIPGFVHILIREEESSLPGSIEYLHECCFSDGEVEYVFEKIDSAKRFVEIFCYLARLPVIKGMCDNPSEYAYGSWVNDYEGMCSINICQTKIVLRRFGFDFMYQSVNNPQVIEDTKSFIDNSFVS